MTAFYWMLIVLSSFIAISSALSDRKLILISLDGFRKDFLKLNITPNLESMCRNGVEATNMWNQFPTKTRVNHFSIATGLTPKSHGVTGNEVWDNNEKKFVKYSKALFQWNRDVVPIWTLNELQYGRTGSMMWAATEYKYKNRYVSFRKGLIKGSTLESRVDGALDWMKKGANFVMMYYEQPDSQGHRYSPDSAKEREMVRKIDDVMNYLDRRLVSNGLFGKTDVIIISDHGMMTVKPRNFINLDRWNDKKSCTIYGTSPAVQVVCKQGKVKNNQNCQRLDAAGRKWKSFRAYQNEHLPERWQFRNSRTGPCTVVAEPGYAFWDMWKYVKVANKITRVPIKDDTPYGIHGYDNAVPQMRPIFIARGPSFKSNVRVDDKFSNVDLYHLFCKILGLRLISEIDGQNRIDIWSKMMKY